MKSGILLGCVLTIGSSIAVAQSSRTQLDDFERNVRPILVDRCYECHSSEAKRIEGGLRLDHPSFLDKGGDSGPAIDRDHPAKSLVLQAIRYEGLEMPPSGKLSNEEIDILTKWIQGGAAWPDEPIPEGKQRQEAFDLDKRMKSHWIWRPIETQAIPTSTGSSTNANPIDAFVGAKQRERGLEPSPVADRGTLVRRLYWDLLGLPPSLDIVRHWQNEQAVDWYSQCLDSVLADPQFGVRFGRHWLDLVRFAQSRGHEFDEDTPGAEHYRDYVIRAWNTDLPFDQFLREQVAGDLMPVPRRHPVSDANESILGTGFWHLGEWVHSPVDTRKDETDRFDNMVDVFSKSFLGLTVSCARCHDHKFDAISTEDYYALYGFLRSSHYRLFRFETDNAESRLQQTLEASRQQYRKRVAELLPTLAETTKTNTEQFVVPTLLESTDPHVKFDSRTLPKELFRSNGQAFGNQVRPAGIDSLVLDRTETSFQAKCSPFPVVSAHSFWLQQKSVVNRTNASNKYGQVDLASKTFSTPSFVLDGDRLSFLVRGSFRAFVAVDSHRLVNGPLHGETIFESKSDDVKQYRWVTGTNLARYRGKRVHIEFSPLSTSHVDLYQIIVGEPSSEFLPRPVSVTGEQLHAYVAASEGLKSESAVQFALSLACEKLIEQSLADSSQTGVFASMRQVIDEWLQKEAENKKQIPIDSRVAIAMHDGSGQNDFLLIRGNSDRPDREVARRLLEALGGKDHPIEARHGSGRMELVEQMLSETNPLVARVFANRIWQHLMGRGIVATPDDFGVQGRLPTHPELLDYLSLQLRANNWSPKRLIKFICESHTYRQRVAQGPLSSLDESNELLSVANVKKLEGEVVRDGLLFVAGQLDTKLDGGDSVRVHLTDFMSGRGRPGTSGSLHGEGRRSIFLEVRRNFLNPMLTAFDMPNPFSAMGKRNASNVPAQALTMMNDPLIHWLAGKWVEAELRLSCTDEERMKRMIESSRGKPAREEELEAVLEYLNSERSRMASSSEREREQAAWSSLAHVLLNAKELVFRF